MANPTEKKRCNKHQWMLRYETETTREEYCLHCSKTRSVSRERSHQHPKPITPA